MAYPSSPLSGPLLHLLYESAPPNKPLQLTRNSSFQLGFGSILASKLVAGSTSAALLRAAERLIR